MSAGILGRPELEHRPDLEYRAPTPAELATSFKLRRCSAWKAVYWKGQLAGYVYAAPGGYAAYNLLGVRMAERPSLRTLTNQLQARFK